MKSVYLQIDTHCVIKCMYKLMKDSKENRYNYLDRYLTGIRARGRYSLTLEELKREFDLPYLTLKQNLYRLKAKNEIVQIRQGFYVILTPEYSKQGILPAYLYLDGLLKYLNKPYYLALISAAALYGAAHQQPMEYFVIVKSPAPRSINNKRVKINFYAKLKFPSEGIIQHKTMAGYVNISSPELTALDLFTFSNIIGINRILSILQELTQEMKPASLTKTVKQYSTTASLQRLGYVLDLLLGMEKLAESVWKVLKERKYFLVPLSTQKSKKGEKNSKWKVIKNIEIESEI